MAARPTRVAFVCHWDWVLHRFRVPVARALLDAGVEVVAICPDGPHVTDLERAGLRWRDWPVDRASLRPTAELGALARLTRILRAERPDAVHLFTVKPILYGAVAARLTRVPTVIAAFSGLGWVFSDDGDAARTQRAVVPALRWALRGATVTAMNPDDLSHLQRRGIADPNRSVLVPEGVDLTSFHPPASPPDNARPRLVVACRLIEDKGIADLVAASARLRDRGVDVDVVVAGAPDPGNPATVPDDDLAAWADTPGITLLGPVDDIAALLHTADVAVLPTRYPEGAPRFLMEAAATGVPAVTTDVPGARLVVEDGDTGVLVPAGDVAALTDALADLVHDDRRRVTLGRRARAHAEEHFDDRDVTRAHAALYRRLGLVP